MLRFNQRIGILRVFIFTPLEWIDRTQPGKREAMAR